MVGKQYPPQEALNILLAEDNEINQRFTVKFLRLRGHSVTAVSNGREALEALAQARYDLVLMDVSMPEMDGIEATLTVRSHDGSSFDPDIPIIAVTAHALMGDKERFLAAGMTAYVSKPLDLEGFERVIRETSRLRPRPAPAPDPPAKEPEPFDLELQEQRFATMKDFLPELLGLFRKNAGLTVDRIRKALSEENLAEAGAAAHTLKGMSSVVCACVLQQLASDLERAAKGGDRQASLTLFADLENQLGRAMDSLRALGIEQP